MSTDLTASDFERFWSKVDMSGDCWLWTGNRDNNGYGRFMLSHRSRSGLVASQLAYEFSRGIKPDAWVLHTCDNPPCVRPTHLKTGTPAENTRDMLVRERCVSKKLQVSDVLEIRRLRTAGIPQREVARRFGVTQGSISNIMLGKTWQWVSFATNEVIAASIDE